MDAFLRLPAVKSLTGLSRSSIYAKVRAGEFPQPVSIGVRSIGWVESEVQQWIAECIQKSRNNPKADRAK
jgi:prophage regulatory protein